MHSRGTESFRFLLIPGDGIGPEIMRAAKKLLVGVAEKYELRLDWEEALMGAAGIDACGTNLPEETWEACKRVDAILYACTGDPRYDNLELDKQPGASLLKLRKRLELYANLRPLKGFRSLAQASPLKPSIVAAGIDIVVVRELTGGLYFGSRGREVTENGDWRAFDTMAYTRREVERIGRIAFELARIRSKRVTSVDKANVLASSQLWRETMEDIRLDYPDVALDHRYVDAFAMQMVSKPAQFDVVVTENTFGDILSDLGSVLVGSIGLLPSVSMGDATWTIDGVQRRKPWLYEPIHGSAPDIAGRNVANPIGLILSLAMAFRHTLKDDDTAKRIERAVEQVLAEGYRTHDIYQNTRQETVVSTEKMGDLIVERFDKLPAE